MGEAKAKGASTLYTRIFLLFCPCGTNVLRLDFVIRLATIVISIRFW